MDTNIRTFLKQLMADAGQTGLPAEVEEQLLEDLNQRLEQRLVLAAMDAMTVEKQLELQKMVEKKTDNEKLSEFIKANLPDADAVFKKAFQEFRDLYLEK